MKRQYGSQVLQTHGHEHLRYETEQEPRLLEENCNRNVVLDFLVVVCYFGCSFLAHSLRFEKNEDYPGETHEIDASESEKRDLIPTY